MRYRAQVEIGEKEAISRHAKCTLRKGDREALDAEELVTENTSG